MIDKVDKRVEETICKHWRELIKGNAGTWIDCYNGSINAKICGSITTRTGMANIYFITERTR